MALKILKIDSRLHKRFLRFGVALTSLLLSDCALFKNQEVKEEQRAPRPVFVKSYIVNAADLMMEGSDDHGAKYRVPLILANNFVCYSPEDHEKILQSRFSSK